ncbi:MAG: hypothetical protein GY822_10965 [Deltaproteobacteria bacterium]|nr:hypothetical protein [Deltaproteobacteria bacterium]
MSSMNVSIRSNYMSSGCQSAIQNSIQTASKQCSNSVQAKMTQTSTSFGSSVMFQSSYRSNARSSQQSIFASSGGCCPSGHMQKPQWGGPLQSLQNAFGGGGMGQMQGGLGDGMAHAGGTPGFYDKPQQHRLNSLGVAMRMLAPMLASLMQMMQGLQSFLGGGAMSQMNNQFKAGNRGCGGGQNVFFNFQSMQHACGNMNTQMGNFLGMNQSLQVGQHGMAASQTTRTTGKPAHFPRAKGSDFLNSLTNTHKNARRLNVSGGHDVKTINSAIGKLKGASATVRPTRPGEKAGAGQLQLSAADTAAIRSAPNQAAAKAIVLAAMGRQTGEKIGPINMGNKKSIQGRHNRHAVNKLLGTKVRNGREKNSGSSLVLDSMADSVAKSVRSGSFGTTNVDSQFAVQQFGQGGCHAMGFQASGYSHTSVENAAGPLTVDLSQYKGAANKVGELYSPLIFDLEGQGLEIKNGGLVEVDLDGDGMMETITDLEAHQGLLVFDSKLSEGDDEEDYALGADLFGNGTDMTAYGIRGPEDDGTFANGFDALRAMAEHFELVRGDKQHLDAADLELLEKEAGLRMRIGGVDNGEDRSFGEVLVSRINLGDADKIQDIKDAQEDAYGNRLMRQDGATFVVNDVERDYVDIWFNVIARAESTKSEEDINKDLIKSMMQVPPVAGRR